MKQACLLCRAVSLHPFTLVFTGEATLCTGNIGNNKGIWEIKVACLVKNHNLNSQCFKGWPKIAIFFSSTFFKEEFLFSSKVCYITAQNMRKGCFWVASGIKRKKSAKEGTEAATMGRMEGMQQSEKTK